MSPSRLESGRGKYCSRPCYQKRPRKGKYFNCIVCGKRKWVRSSQIKAYGEPKYCSRECFYSNIKKENHPHWKGGLATRKCKNCGEKFEIQLSPSVIEKGWGIYCSTDCHNEDQRGEKSPSWKGGLDPRSSLEYKQWRKAVYARDNWTCQDCGISGVGNLNAHHVFSYAQFPEHQLEVWNGVTVCIPCHQKYHPNMHILGAKSNAS